VVIFALFACLARKRLQIGTDVLPIITSTGDVFLMVSTPMTLNDPEPQNRDFNDFLQFFAAEE